MERNNPGRTHLPLRVVVLQWSPASAAGLGRSANNNNSYCLYTICTDCAELAVCILIHKDNIKKKTNHGKKESIFELLKCQLLYFRKEFNVNRSNRNDRQILTKTETDFLNDSLFLFHLAGYCWRVLL